MTAIPAGTAISVRGEGSGTADWAAGQSMRSPSTAKMMSSFARASSSGVPYNRDARCGNGMSASLGGGVDRGRCSLRQLLPRIGVELEAQRISAGVVGGDFAIDVLGVVAEGRDRFGAREQPSPDRGDQRV